MGVEIGVLEQKYYVPRSFIKRVKDHRVPPHGDRHSIVAIRQAVRADEKALRLGKDPHAEEQEEVDKVAEIREKVVITPLMVRIKANGHKVAQLCGEPVIKVFGMGTNQVAADEYI